MPKPPRKPRAIKSVTDAKLRSPEQDRRDLRIKWVIESEADLRARTQAEYLYTAGALAMFGGVSWGVLSLQHNAQWAGSIAVLGIPVVAFFIDKKISRDHLEYAKIRRARARLVRQPDPHRLIVPASIRRPRSGRGYRYSQRVLWAAAGVIVALCLVDLAGWWIGGFLIWFAFWGGVDWLVRWFRRKPALRALSERLRRFAVSGLRLGRLWPKRQ